MAGEGKTRRGDEARALAELREEFASAMRELRRRQRAAIEKAEKAVDARKLRKIRKSLDELTT